MPKLQPIAKAEMLIRKPVTEVFEEKQSDERLITRQ